MPTKKLNFHNWLIKNDENHYAEIMETGLSNELDFNRQQWEDLKYEEYLNEETS